MDDNPGSKDKDHKSFSERVEEAKIMPDALLQAVDGTDLAILAIEKGAKESMDKEGS